MTEVRYTWQRSSALVLMIIAIVFWLWFGIGSAYVEKMGPSNRLMHSVVPGGIFILSTLVALRWDGIGGVLLVLEGLVALGFIVRAFLWGSFTASTLVLMCLTLGLPPLVAGILFLICWRQSAAPREIEKEIIR
jgi:predicted anti-sigma-YlaC factor YlaD